MGDLYATIDESSRQTISISARLFAHLLRQRAIHWSVFDSVKPSPETMTTSRALFVEALLQELGETMTVARLKEEMSGPEDAVHLRGLFPRDSMQNAAFALNFFVTISERRRRPATAGDEAEGVVR